MGNAYDNASLVLTPNGYKAGKMYSAKPTDGTGDLAFSRASTALRRNSAGLWESVANNVPRLQYPVGGGCPSWLFEPQATNSILYSTDFSNAAWVVVGTAAKAVSAHASLISGGVAYDITGLDNSFSQYFGQALSGLTTTTFQVFIKAVVVGDVGKKIRIDSNTAGNTDITLTSDWQEFSSYFAASSSGIYFFGKPNSGTPATQFTICYAGREAGTVATSPIITAGSTVTRLADLATKTGIGSLIGQSEGTIYIEASMPVVPAYFTLSDGSPSNRIIVYSTGTAQINVLVQKAGSTQAFLAYAFDITTTFKVAFTYSTNSFKLFVNGVLRATDTLGDTFTTELTRVGFDSSTTGDNVFSSKTNEVIIYKTAISDSEAIELTTL
jgi:hypothetical protein